MSERLEDIEKYEKRLREKGDVGNFVIALVNLTGREVDELPSEIEFERALDVIKVIWQNLNQIDKTRIKIGDDETHELLWEFLNQASWALGYEAIDKHFYDITIRESIVNEFYKNFEETKKDNILNYVEYSTQLFRQFSMFYYGNFKFAFRKFRRASVDDRKLLKKQWDDLFIPRKFPPHSKTIGLMNIDEDLKWCLGYLAVKYSKIVSDSREKLVLFLNQALAKNCSSFDELTKIPNFPFNEYFTSYLPPRANLLPIYDSLIPFKERLESAIKICGQDVEQRIKEMQKLGRQNMFVYLTLPEIDIYFATSMRTPEHFYNASQLIHTLFKKDRELNKSNLRVFDPTNSFSHDRLDKGLIECLMIARSKVTLYNAQEMDTFGKDSEAALSLVMRHPVIVYVARLFETQLNEIYDFVDLAPKKDIDSFFDIFKTAFKGLYSKYSWNFKDMDKELLKLQKAPLTHERLIDMYIDKALPEALKNMKEADILGELDYHGYLSTDIYGKSRDQLIEHSRGVVKKLEKRALIFLTGHPLSMLASPLDGVARGVLITRSVSKTKDIVYKLLNREFKYRVERNEYGWRLIEKETESPIRIITFDRTLTSAFWDKFLSDTNAS